MSKKTILLFLLIFTFSCGTLIGNGAVDPTEPSYGAGMPGGGFNLNFSAAINEYNENNSTNCGSFTENSTQTQIETGRNCIRDAFDACTNAKYLINKANSDGSRFVSFVNVEIATSSCVLNVHTISNVPPENIGDKKKSCSILNDTEIPETACGIID